MQLTIIYFAWVRERIGIDSEDIDLPYDVTTIAALLDWLRGRDERYVRAFAEPDKLRFAVDQEMVRADHSLSGARELAIFPPVTGG